MTYLISLNNFSLIKEIDFNFLTYFLALSKILIQSKNIKMHKLILFSCFVFCRLFKFLKKVHALSLHVFLSLHCLMTRLLSCLLLIFLLSFSFCWGTFHCSWGTSKVRQFPYSFLSICRLLTKWWRHKTSS